MELGLFESKIIFFSPSRLALRFAVPFLDTRVFNFLDFPPRWPQICSLPSLPSPDPSLPSCCQVDVPQPQCSYGADAQELALNMLQKSQERCSSCFLLVTSGAEGVS